MNNALQKNLALLDTVRSLYDFSANSCWKQANENFTGEHVKIFYEEVAKTWPLHTNPEEILPQPTSKPRVIYVGDRPNKSSMLRDISRISLYADEILIADPLHDAYDPHLLEDHKPYRFDTFQRLKFLHKLDPWVRAGIVTFCPDPFKVKPVLDKQLSKALLEARRQRQSFSQRLAEQLTKIFPKSKGEAFDHEAVQDLVESRPELLQKYMELYFGPAPYYDDEEPDNSELTVMQLKGDFNLRELLFAATVSESVPISSSAPLISSELEDLLPTIPKVPWDAISGTLTSVDIPFLDRVDINFALRMREEGRLEGFRQALRDLWNKIDQKSSGSVKEFSLEFRDRLQQAHREAEAEWTEIDRDLLKWAGPTLGGAIATGALTLTLPALGLTVAAATMLVISRTKRRSFREKNPMSLLVDLAHK